MTQKQVIGVGLIIAAIWMYHRRKNGLGPVFLGAGGGGKASSPALAPNGGAYIDGNGVIHLRLTEYQQ